MKARLARPGPGTAWEFEIKWDGYRAIAFCGKDYRLQGRRLNRITADFPELDALGRDARTRGTVLDGELVVFDENGRPDFQLMQSRQEEGLEAHFLIFDLLWHRERDLRNSSYLERRETLESLDLAGGQWSVPERIDASLDEALAATEQLGLEGVVAKDPESPYVEDRRTGYWRKVKHVRRQEFVVGGWLPGKGHRADTLGALLVGYQEQGLNGLRFAGRVGTGMDDELLARIANELTVRKTPDSPFDGKYSGEIPRDARWCEPRSVIEVKFTEWTRDGRLRNPVFAGFRPDKTAAEVVREEK